MRSSNQVDPRVELHQKFSSLRHIPDVLCFNTCLEQGSQYSKLEKICQKQFSAFSSHLNLNTAGSGQTDVDGVSQDPTTFSKDFCSDLSQYRHLSWMASTGKLEREKIKEKKGAKKQGGEKQSNRYLVIHRKLRKKMAERKTRQRVCCTNLPPELEVKVDDRLHVSTK